MTTPPTDLEGFESVMRKAREAGLLPLQLGNAEGHAVFLDYLATSDAGVFQFESGFIPVNAEKQHQLG